MVSNYEVRAKIRKSITGYWMDKENGAKDIQDATRMFYDAMKKFYVEGLKVYQDERTYEVVASVNFLIMATTIRDANRRIYEVFDKLDAQVESIDGIWHHVIGKGRKDILKYLPAGYLVRVNEDGSDVIGKFEYDDENTPSVG